VRNALDGHDWVCLQAGISQKTVDHLFSKLDVSGDGTIDEEEFTRVGELGGPAHRRNPTVSVTSRAARHVWAVMLVDVVSTTGYVNSNRNGGTSDWFYVQSFGSVHALD
jgi:hypothetical protein